MAIRSGVAISPALVIVIRIDPKAAPRVQVGLRKRSVTAPKTRKGPRLRKATMRALVMIAREAIRRQHSIETRKTCVCLLCRCPAVAEIRLWCLVVHTLVLVDFVLGEAAYQTLAFS